MENVIQDGQQAAAHKFMPVLFYRESKVLLAVFHLTKLV